MKSRILSLWSFVVAVGAMAAEPQYQWRQTDSSLALAAGNRVVWQLTFNQEEGKPYFHPLSLADGTVFTALRPADHPWHRGLWWSWKYINGINYWEEDKAGQSQGRTELAGVRVERHADYSARVEMDLSYHPSGKPVVMTEKRVLSVSAPDARGNYRIDWESAFTAGPEHLKLDRTPPKNWAGGYAGLGLRLAAATKSWKFTSSEGIVGATNIYGQRARWLDFSGPGGVTMFDSPQNPRHPTAWYPNSSMPWCTPAFLFHEPYELAAGATLNLRYGVLVHSEPLDQAALDRQWASFTNRANAKRILVYTRNGLGLNGKPGFVHDNIASSVAALRQLGDEHGFAVDASDDPKSFTDANLKQYRALVFSNSNNESFENEAQKSALQHYIRAGGGFVGIHSACGSNRNWPWFWALLGGTFERHPPMQPFTINVVDRGHPSTSFLGETWRWTDEFYYLKKMAPDLHVLLTGDLSTLTDPAKPKGELTRPLAWYHEFEGGRSWFTALGHKKEHYADPQFQKHLLGGILWAMGSDGK